MGGQFSGLINVEKTSIGTPSDRLLVLTGTGNQPRLATFDRVQIVVLIRANGSNPLRIRRDRKRVAINAFWCDSSRLACRNLEHIELFALFRLIARKQNPFAICKPMSPVVIDGIVGEILSLARSRRQKS